MHVSWATLRVMRRERVTKIAFRRNLTNFNLLNSKQDVKTNEINFDKKK